MAKIHEKSVLILADIHWSKAMENAWKKIIQHPKVSLSIDLYHFGVLFFEDRKEKEQLSLVPWYWKPWHLGIWK